MMNFIKNLASNLWLVVICVLLCFMLYKSIKQVESYRMKAEPFERTISDLHQDIDETIIRMNDSISLYQAKVKSLSFSDDNLKARYNDLLKASKLPMMKSAFCYGCHVSLNYLFNDPDIDVHLKRICYRTGGTENPSIMDLLKEVCHILFRNAKNGDLQIYEDGSITRYRKQDIKKIKGKLL